jgi:hypothetical protein
MSRVSAEIITGSCSTLTQTYKDQAIQVCINKWNQFCPEYPIEKSAKIIKQKHWLPFGHDVTVIEMSEKNDEISKIIFDIDNKLTAKALRKHSEPTKIFVSCRIWWNYKGYRVRGFLDHIEFDVTKGNITRFPQIIPVYPYWENSI